MTLPPSRKKSRDWVKMGFSRWQNPKIGCCGCRNAAKIMMGKKRVCCWVPLTQTTVNSLYTQLIKASPKKLILFIWKKCFFHGKHWNNFITWLIEYASKQLKQALVSNCQEHALSEVFWVSCGLNSSSRNTDLMCWLHNKDVFCCVSLIISYIG